MGWLFVAGLLIIGVITARRFQDLRAIAIDSREEARRESSVRR